MRKEGEGHFSPTVREEGRERERGKEKRGQPAFLTGTREREGERPLHLRKKTHTSPFPPHFPGTQPSSSQEEGKI